MQRIRYHRPNTNSLTLAHMLCDGGGTPRGAPPCSHDTDHQAYFKANDAKHDSTRKPHEIIAGLDSMGPEKSGCCSSPEIPAA